MNEIYALLLTLCNFVLIYAAYKFFGKTGLIAYIALSVIAMNIQVTKTVEVLGFVTSLGNAMYSGIYLATDALNEKYGAVEARKSVWIGFFVMLVFTITTQLTLMIEPHASDVADPHLQEVFGIFPALLTVSFLAFLTSQQLDVSLYKWIKSKLPERKYLWVRNNGSTLISQLVDSFIFTFFMMDFFPWGIFAEGTFWSIFLTSYAIKGLIALLDTPFMYLLTKTKTIEWKNKSVTTEEIAKENALA